LGAAEETTPESGLINVLDTWGLVDRFGHDSAHHLRHGHSSWYLGFRLKSSCSRHSLLAPRTHAKKSDRGDEEPGDIRYH
jgi:hypothetical protein